jgi:diaminopropionate ammonia-lyase
VPFLANPHRIAGHRPAEPALDARAARGVAELLGTVFHNPPTPLRALPGIARRLGVAEVCLKDEGARLGLKSFKALGGAYALIRMVLETAGRTLGRPVAPSELPRPPDGTLGSLAGPGFEPPAGSPLTRVARDLTFACATDGNHGQSVAAGARLTGARAVIFVHEGVSMERREAIARFGAEMRVVPGTYDDAVAAALDASGRMGWTLLSDTSWPGYSELPLSVMQGYTLMAHELAAQLAAPPTHVFLQAGVGGFAAALAVALTDAFPEAPPEVVVVEPSRAACLLASAQAGRSVRVAEGEPTVMSMLECFEPSLVAWTLLRPLAAAFMTVEDDDALAAMRTLAHPADPAEIVVCGESGAAGLAGLEFACADPAVRAALGLAPDSRVLLIGTESATDEARYLAAVGDTPSALRARLSAGTARPA